MLALGVDPKAIQALVRHAEIDMTMYYAHAQDATKQDAIQRYTEAFSHREGGLHGNVLKFVKSGLTLVKFLSPSTAQFWVYRGLKIYMPKSEYFKG